MTVERCPGSHQPPYMFVDRETAVRMGKVMVDSYGVCQYCRRKYYVTSQGVLHIHNGLAKAPDGGCPYRCPGPECDFACYFREAS